MTWLGLLTYITLVVALHLPQLSCSTHDPGLASNVLSPHEEPCLFDVSCIIVFCPMNVCACEAWLNQIRTYLNLLRCGRIIIESNLLYFYLCRFRLVYFHSTQLELRNALYVLICTGKMLHLGPNRSTVYHSMLYWYSRLIINHLIWCLFLRGLYFQLLLATLVNSCNANMFSRAAD